MNVQYLEIVTREVDAVCAAYASALNVQFGEPDAGPGAARTAVLAVGGLMESVHPYARVRIRWCDPTGL